MSSALFLDDAVAIAERIASSAIDVGGGVTWRIPTLTESDTVGVLAGGGFYEGSSGIAMFLAQAGYLAKDERLIDTAQMAIRHALSDQALDNHPCAFFTGALGVTWAAVHVARVANSGELSGIAMKRLSTLITQQHRQTGLDVIGGAAGAIPVLLNLASLSGNDEVVSFAESLGDQLLHAAHRVPEGWSWGAMQTSKRDLTGYAHGTSGFAVALLELWSATRHGRFLYGSDQAFRFEAAHFDAKAKNWYDFRYPDLSTISHQEGDAGLRERIRRGERFAWHEQCMIGWCHGAPGIGLTRFRAYELTGNNTRLREALDATSCTTDDLPSVRSRGASLCHGLAGNAFLLLRATETTGDPEPRKVAEAEMLAGAAKARATGGRWPSGAKWGRPTPSLMLGDAGIGYMLLHLVSPTVPPFLLVRGSTVISSADLPKVETVRAQLNRVDPAFENTAAASVRLNICARDWWDRVAPTDQKSVTRVTADALHELIALYPQQADLLADASAVDAAAFKLCFTELDLAQDYLEVLGRDDETTSFDPSHRWRLSASVRVVEQLRDWDSWLFGTSEPPPSVAVSPHVTLVLRRKYAIVRRRLTGFAAAAFAEMKGSFTGGELVDRLLSVYDVISRDDLDAAVRAQLIEASAGGIIVREFRRE